MNLREVAQLTQQERDQRMINFSNIESWLNRVGIENFTIDRDTLVVDVQADVDLGRMNFSVLPVTFGNVSGNFHVGGCKNLKTLKGCPHSVGGDFTCFHTAITSLQGAPSTVKGIFNCDATPNMPSLSGVDKIVRECSQFWGGKDVTHVLGLLLIPKIGWIDLDGTDGPLNDILNKYLETHDVLSAQDELIDAGFTKQARF